MSDTTKAAAKAKKEKDGEVTVVLTDTVDHDGVRHAPDDELTLPEPAAEALRLAGVAKPKDGKAG